MPNWDWIMGTVAIVLGLTLAVSAIANARWLMELRRPKWLAEKIGRGAARSVLVAIGVLTLALGVLILSGWRPPWIAR